MPAPLQGACTPFATLDDLCSPCSDEYGLDTALLEANLIVASDLLFEWSGRRFAGCCEDTVRPAGRVGAFRADRWPGSGVWDGRTWNGLCGCNRSSRTGCHSVSEITLGGYPLTGVTQVMIDGAVVDPARYRVDDYRWLVYLPDPSGVDTRKGFPCCQAFTLASTEVGTFEVQFTYGTPPPPAGVRAAADLACQLTLACQPEDAGGGACTLPQRVSQVVRQDVTYLILQGRDYLDEIKMAVPAVGSFLSAYNPDGIKRRAVVASPDTPRRVRRVGT